MSFERLECKTMTYDGSAHAYGRISDRIRDVDQHSVVEVGSQQWPTEIPIDGYSAVARSNRIYLGKKNTTHVLEKPSGATVAVFKSRV